jgi:hypothetical protein
MKEINKSNSQKFLQKINIPRIKSIIVPLQHSGKIPSS